MKAQTTLAHYPDGTQFSRVTARLSWTDDDRLVLERVGDQGEALETYFDAPIPEVRITGAMTTPKFTVNGTGYRVDFNEAARFASAAARIAGGVHSDPAAAASLGIQLGGTNASGVQEWMAALTAAGATSKYWTSSKVVLASIIGAVVIVVGAFIGVVITAIIAPVLIYG